MVDEIIENEEDNEGERVRITLRLPPELHKLLNNRRKILRRSLNEEIVIILDRFVDAKEIIVPSKEYIGFIEDARRLEKEKTPTSEE